MRHNFIKKACVFSDSIDVLFERVDENIVSVSFDDDNITTLTVFWCLKSNYVSGVCLVSCLCDFLNSAETVVYQK